MSTESRFVGNSIEELLVSLAEGVREAQIALNTGPRTDLNGTPLAAYHLPYLDFEIRVDIETRTDTGGRPVALLFTTRDQSTSSRQVRSSISGRLVATPPGEGLPVPWISLAAEPSDSGAAVLTLTVTNSAGEVLAGQPVELNIDAEASASLSAARGVETFVRKTGTRLEAAMLRTDTNGRAVTRLLIDKEPKGAVVVVVASIGAFNARAVVGVGSSK